MNDANTRAQSPQKKVVPNANNRCHCGREAAGIDAQTRRPICRDCADDSCSDMRFICDGGTSWWDLTGFQLNLLREIVESDQPSGQTIRRNIESKTGDEINHGRLYPNLDDLVDYQLIEKGSQDQRTNYYEVTNDGRRLAEQIADDFDLATTQPLAAATDGGPTGE